MQDSGLLVSRGTRMLMWSMIVAVIGSIVSGAVLIYMILRGLASYFLPGSIGTTTSVLNTTYLNSTTYIVNSTVTTVPSNIGRIISSISGALYVVIGIAVVFGVAELALQWIGWSSLRAADSRYSIGRTGVALIAAGAALSLASLAAILEVLPGLLSSISQAPGAAVSVLPVIAGAGILSFAGAVLAIAGVVMLYVGLWRLGSAYNNWLIKASIILVIAEVVGSALVGALDPVALFALSFLGIASAVMMIVGLHEVSVAAGQKGP